MNPFGGGLGLCHCLCPALSGHPGHLAGPPVVPRVRNTGASLVLPWTHKKKLEFGFLGRG